VWESLQPVSCRIHFFHAKFREAVMGNVTAMQAITLAIAVLGAVLGVINTWLGLDKSRVKLRVAPAHAIPVGGADPRLQFCLTISNLSAFSVTIEEAGILYSRSTDREV
jgi:hypothetical protein